MLRTTQRPLEAESEARAASYVVTRHCYLGGSERSKKLKGPEPTLGYQIPPWGFKAWRGRKRDQAIHREIL